MGKLTEEKVKEFQKIINERSNGHFKCPICSSTIFNVVPREAIVTFQEDTKHGLIMAPVEYRKYLLQSCDNCGHVIMFDTQALSSK